MDNTTAVPSRQPDIRAWQTFWQMGQLMVKVPLLGSFDTLLPDP